MSNKKVKVQWAVSLDEIPSVMKELFYRALNHFNHIDLINNVETSIAQNNVEIQLTLIDKLRREMALFDERLSDIYYQLFAYQSEIMDERRKEMLSNQNLQEDLSSKK
jgi:hypothetical protein